MIRLTSIAIALMSVSLPALANQCELESPQENHQASKFEVTVKNRAVNPIWVTTKGQNKKGVTISSGDSLTRTFHISKDSSLTPTAVERSDFGINVGSGSETDIGRGYQRIWNLRFTVTNALTGVSGEKPKRMSHFTTAQSLKGPKTRNFVVKCSAAFSKKGKNAWEYTIEIADK